MKFLLNYFKRVSKESNFNLKKLFKKFFSTKRKSYYSSTSFNQRNET